MDMLDQILRHPLYAAEAIAGITLIVIGTAHLLAEGLMQAHKIVKGTSR